MTEPDSPAKDVEDAPPAVDQSATSDNSHQLISMLNERLRLAFSRASAACGGEKVIWDAYLVPAPHPLQPGQIVTGLAVFVMIPSSVLGQAITITAMADPQLAEAEQGVHDEFARDRLNELLAARGQQAMDQAVQEAAVQNGHREPPSPASGLIVPGRG